MRYSINPYFAGVLLILSGYSSIAQGLFAKKAMQDEAMNHFVDASDAYQGIYERGSREASLQAARNLYKARHYEEALPLYEHADSLKIITDADEVFRYFECLKSVKRYEDADRIVRTRINDFQGRPEFGLHEEKLSYYNKLSSFKGVELSPLGMNSKYSDISPTVYDGWLYFVSTRPAAGNYKVHRINMQPFYNLYAVPLDGDMKTTVSPVGEFGQPEETIRLNTQSGKSLPDGINRNYHDGPIQVVPSGKLLFFTSNHSDAPVPKAQKGSINLRIYFSEKQGEIWTAPKELPSNSFEYSNQHAYFDEATFTLYFSSNRPGGKGGYDIWKSKRNSDGTWTDAENLGDRVNTAKTEVFPSLTPDGQLLFASNGWPGLGGLDVFLADGDSKQPLNLMAGINSEKDDFGLYFTSRNEGYLGSNRAGSAGDDDIWKFRMEWDVKTVRRFNSNSGDVKIAALDAVTGVGVPVKVSVADAENTAIASAVSGGSEGTVMELTVGQQVTVSAGGYAPVTVTVTEEMVATGSYAPKITALPTYKEGLLTITAKDATSGGDLEAGYVLLSDGASTGGLLSSGKPVPVKAGDRIQLTASGYESAFVDVTEDMIRTGNVDLSLAREKIVGSAMNFIISDAGNGKPIDAVLDVVRDGKTIRKLFTADGGSMNLKAGETVTIRSDGFEPRMVRISKADVKRGRLAVGLSAVRTSTAAVTTTDPEHRTTSAVPVGTLVVRPIYFDFDRSGIRRDARQTLDSVVMIMKADAAMKVELVSSADCRGTEEYNRRLSERRALATLQYLRERIPNPDRISARGIGELPSANCACDEHGTVDCPAQILQRNRRTEIRIVKQ